MSMIAASICAFFGGCEFRWRSDIRTHPIFTLFANSTLSVPRTNSVEPPPISTTKNGPSARRSSCVAPLKESAASSVPGITSGSIPRISFTPSINICRLEASRVALVAQKRIFSTPLLRIISAYFWVTARVRAIASGSNWPVLSTP